MDYDDKKAKASDKLIAAADQLRRSASGSMPDNRNEPVVRLQNVQREAEPVDFETVDVEAAVNASCCSCHSSDFCLLTS